jgi:hypothetical protein
VASEASGPRTADLVGGLLGVFGALVTILACLLPYAQYSSDSDPASPSVFNPGFDGGLWYAAEPAVVILMGIAGGLLIVLSRRELVQIAGAAALVALGVQTFFLFVGYAGSALSADLESLGVGSVLGLAGGMCLLTGGIIAIVSISGRATPLASASGTDSIR